MATDNMLTQQFPTGTSKVQESGRVQSLTWIPHSIHSERNPTTVQVLIVMQQKLKQALSSD